MADPQSNRAIPSPEGPAVSDEATRVALGAYERAGQYWLVGGLLAIAIGILIDAVTPYVQLGGISGLGIVALAIAFVMLRRVRRWHRVLTDRPWQAFRAEYLPVKPATASAGLLLTPDSAPTSQPAPLKIDEVTWRQGGLDGERDVWVCGDPAASVVVAPPGAGALYAASAPHGYLGRKWSKAHSDELAARGIHLSVAIKRRWIGTSLICFVLSLLLLIAVAGFFVHIAERQTQLGNWTGVVVCALLAAAIGWLGLRAWAKIAA